MMKKLNSKLASIFVAISVGAVLLNTGITVSAEIESRTKLTFAGERRFEAYKKVDGSEVQIHDKDISAVTCIESGICFAASDETRFLQTFSIVGDELSVGGRLYLKLTKIGKERKDFDIEALASVGNTIIAVGSHSWKRKKCKPSKKGRVNVVYVGDVDPKLISTRTPMDFKELSLINAFSKFPILQHFYDTPLQQNGLNIEGATVLNGIVYFGLRAPFYKGENNAAFILSVPIDDLREEQFDAAELHPVRLAEKPGMGIRGLETVGDHILILSGKSGVGPAEEANDADDLKEQVINGCFQRGLFLKHPYSLYLWKPGERKARFLTNVEPKGSEKKAEGLLLLNKPASGSDKLDLLVIFDGIKGGQPTRFSISTQD